MANFPLIPSAPASHSIQPFDFISNSSLDLQDLNRAHCVDSAAWGLSHFTTKDCEDAYDHLARSDEARLGARLVQFVATHTTPFPQPSPVIFCPRRYTVGSCTVAIMMLVDFPASEPFPEEPPGPHLARDSANFLEVWEAAGSILHRCVKRRELPGWEVIGRDGGAIGIFIWGTGCEIDRANEGSPWELVQ